MGRLIILVLVSVGGWFGYQTDVVIVSDFEEVAVGELSSDWHQRRKSDLLEYQVMSQEGNQYLHAATAGTDMMVVKKIEIDIVEYPYVSWRWRVHELPVMGDESVKQYCDVPASISFVTNRTRLVPKSIKYTWSTTLTEGAVTESPFAFWPARTDIIVLESGAERQGQWVTVKRNILEDYKKLYGKKSVKSKVLTAIAIMSDSDNTGTTSVADYDDILFSKY